jgi:CRISPR-associated protein Cas1
MATLILDRSHLELRCDGAAALAIYEGGERRGTVPLRLIERVVLQGNIQLDTGVLGRLAQTGVPIILLGARSSRRVAILLGPAHGDASIRLGQFQRSLDAAWCATWSRRLVLRKARAQLRLLRRALGERPEACKPLFDVIETIETIVRSLAGDLDIVRERVRGYEGACAAAYFRGYCALFAESLEFRSRNRRPPKDPVNAALSLVYTLLHFDAVRAAYAAGLDPMVGFYHRPAHGRESLACAQDRFTPRAFKGHASRKPLQSCSTTRIGATFMVAGCAQHACACSPNGDGHGKAKAQHPIPTRIGSLSGDTSIAARRSHRKMECGGCGAPPYMPWQPRQRHVGACPRCCGHPETSRSICRATFRICWSCACGSRSTRKWRQP